MDYLFKKYHGLGNDYLVMGPEIPEDFFTPAFVRRICDHHYGVGSDGLLHGPLPSQTADVRVRMYNPDGGEFEKSGNGLRIFTRYLFDRGDITDKPVIIETKGGLVTARVLEGGNLVRVDMGRASLKSEDIPVRGESREVLNEPLTIKDRVFNISAVTVGNPHCVVLLENEKELTPDLAKTYGPLLEHHPLFPHRTNVQFMVPLDEKNIRIEIWERGVGYTLASGSSSCAAATVAHRLGLCGTAVDVHVPGGIIHLDIQKDSSLIMTAPVVKICEGAFSPESLP
ncbi:MAG: diaminopimelate epimerase [Candidatus Marinimicrobia bacterium]|nr:diaminopimelate epimerase [Candidatus Neomarinimicrobiota bacterium]MDD5582797.1 diaminopimelate epimerase [Candidatus Neomarinimicrobiota bacterium]